MTYTVNDLFPLNLPPAEFKTACYMLAVAQGDLVRIDTKVLADSMGCSLATTRRTISSLVKVGLFRRTSRGVYLVQNVEAERSLVSDSSQKRSNMSVLSTLDTTSTTSTVDSLVEPKGSTSSGGAAPVRGISMVKIDYDDGDHLSGVGLTEPKSQPKKTKQDIRFHRLIPKDQWDTRIFVKEFRQRLYETRPDILGGGTDSRDMTIVLNLWRKNHGLSMPDMLTAMDLFFAEQAKTLRETPKPYKVFLKFLQNQYRGIMSSDDDDWLESLDDQLEDFRG